MNNRIKPLSRLLLLIILVSGLCLPVFTNSSPVQASDVNDIPEPSVPEFTVKLADNSYDVPTTYSIDKFTGDNITHHGYHVENKTIEVTIKN